jgi:hypothetical protein
MTGIASVLISFTLYVLTHWAVCRWAHWRPHSRVINLLWLCFLPVYFLLFWVFAHYCPFLAVGVTSPLGVVDLLNGLCLNLLLLIGYTYFFFLVERGFSLRLMRATRSGKSSRWRGRQRQHASRVWSPEDSLRQPIGISFSRQHSSFSRP